MVFPVRIPNLNIDGESLAQFCRLRRIRSMRFYGSILRSDFGPESDIDVLVEFDSGVDPDLFELGGLQQDLTDLLGRDVDLKTPEMFSEPALRHVMGGARVGYAA